MTQALASDRYDHDMTAEAFLSWLHTQSRDWIVTGPAAVWRYLYERGHNVVDTCEETATLLDTCGCRHVRALPTALTRALREVGQQWQSVPALIVQLETRL